MNGTKLRSICTFLHRGVVSSLISCRGEVINWKFFFRRLRHLGSFLPGLDKTMVAAMASRKRTINRRLSRASRSLRLSIGSHCLSACTLALKLIRRCDTFSFFCGIKHEQTNAVIDDQMHQDFLNAPSPVFDIAGYPYPWWF